MEEKPFFPFGAIVFFVGLILFFTVIWFAVFWIMISRP